MRKPLSASVITLIVLVGALLAAEERPDQAVFWKIRQEATGNSQIMRTLHMLTDVHGPRLTGSPNLKAAGEWAIQQMQSWGMKNGRLEPWDFGHPGWTNERLAAYIVSPVKDTLVAEVLGAIRVVQSFNQEDREAERFAGTVDRTFGAARRRYLYVTVRCD